MQFEAKFMIFTMLNFPR